ncbi:hypothetical protein [Marinimicrobium sp. ABcell2]|uniref:hypothetical protein n=1 Tax=Marinimicrobium sp. ABcell2 TaxID=3069751 RepID=UPI0027B43F04|nr:hypothetical protein [Marinimicrobium sp. ABcell2]MDQ2075478.1 hypothetical protein [Marinimicrobium sp. ABcell2]
MIARQPMQPALQPIDDAANGYGDPTMQAAKQDALNTINQLPDNADMEEIMYRLYVLDKVRKGQEAVEQGKTLTSEQLQRDIDSW